VAQLSDEDWGKIHAKAWLEPDFRALLEKDPTAAIRAYEKSIGKTAGYFDKIVRVNMPDEAAAKRFTEKELAKVAPWPPWCC
jgi:hypothetical protein